MAGVELLSTSRVQKKAWGGGNAATETPRPSAPNQRLAAFTATRVSLVTPWWRLTPVGLLLKFSLPAVEIEDVVWAEPACCSSRRAGSYFD